MRIYVSYGDDCLDDGDAIDVSEEVYLKIGVYLNEFWDWLYNKDNNHNYWCYRDGEKIGCSYDIQAFVEWLRNSSIDPSASVIKHMNVAEKRPRIEI